MHNQPTADFYRLEVDNQFPYRVYGAQQDNSTISLPSRSQGGLTPYEEWYDVGGCESGHIAVDPRDPDLYYAGCYNGILSRVNRRTGESRNVMPAPVLVDGLAPKELDDRFQWNFPIVFSPNDPNTLYATSQRVLKSTDQGMSWEVISPDLTWVGLSGATAFTFYCSRPGIRGGHGASAPAFPGCFPPWSSSAWQ